MSSSQSSLSEFSDENRLKFDQFNIMQIDFYQSFAIFRRIEACELIGFKIEENGCYVNYTIYVRTKEVEYSINRRYSAFHELYSEVLKNHKEISISNFPQKRWFGNLEEKVINERIIKFREFLKLLILNCQRLKIYEIMAFLALDQAYEFFGYHLNTFSFDKVKMHASNQEDELCLELLIKMNLNDSSLSHLFLEFESRLCQRKLFVLSNMMVQILLMGESNLKGLMEICGKVDEDSSHFTCHTGLKLLCSLMNHEKNPGADEFIKVFTDCHLKQLSLLNLSSHILSLPCKNCKPHALLLLKIYLDGNPDLSSYLIETILESEEAYMEYNKWKKNHQLSSQKAENFNVENEQVCKKTSGFFEEIDSFSTTLKKLKSPLFRKRNNNSYKKNQKEKVDSGRKS